MKLYKLSCPIFLLLMIFLASNCSGGGITFKDAFDKDLGRDNTGRHDKAMCEAKVAAHALLTEKYDQQIKEYMSKENARLSAEKKEEADLALNLVQLIAIDPAHKEGLPEQLRVAVLNIETRVVKSQLSVRDLRNRTAFDMALDVGNYTLIQDFLALGLPLIDDEDVTLLELLVKYLSEICKNEINQKDQDHFVALFNKCLKRILEDQETLDVMDDGLPRGISPYETAWGSIVNNIFSAVYFTPHKQYYKSMFDQLTNSLIIKKSPDLILNYKIKLPEKYLTLSEEREKFKQESEGYLKNYVEDRKKKAEQVKKTEEQEENPEENRDDDCCFRFLKLMIHPFCQ